MKPFVKKGHEASGPSRTDKARRREVKMNTPFASVDFQKEWWKNKVAIVNKDKGNKNGND